MYLSKELMNLKGAKWLVDSRGDIVILDITLIKLDNVSYITYLRFWPHGIKMPG